MTLAKQAGWALFWNAAFMPLKGIVAIAVSVVVVRLLRTDGFAALTVVTSLLTTLGLYSDLGIERSISRFVPQVEAVGGRRAVTRLLMRLFVVKVAILSCVGAGVLLGSGWLLASFGLRDEGWAVALYIVVMLFMGAASDFFVQTLYAYFRQKATNALDVLASLVNPLLTAAFIVLGLGMWGALLALFVTTLASTLLSGYWAFRALSLSREGSGDLPEGLLGDFVRYAGLSYLITISAYFTDLPFLALLISRIGTPGEVAILALGFKLVRQVLRLLVLPLTGIQAPLFARIRVERSAASLTAAYGSLTRLLAILLIPSGLGLMMLGDHALSILYLQRGSDAVLRADNLGLTYGVVALLTVCFFGEALLSSAQTVLMVYGRYGIVMVCRLVAILGGPAAVALGIVAGPLGAAAAVGTAALASRIASSAYLHVALQVPFPGKFVAKVLLASAAYSTLVLPASRLFQPSWPITLGIVALGALAFILAFKTLGGLDEEDRRYMLSARLPMAEVILRWV
jgi:O-antigen/teichoic acid export membrane protein